MTDPPRKERYLQQRWYNQSIGKKKTGEVLTPVSVLKQVLELDRYVSTLDIHRMDKEGLQVHIMEILSDEVIEKLNFFNDLAINREITTAILRCISSLPLHLTEKIYQKLERIKNDELTNEMIREHNLLRQRVYKWEKYRTALILLVVLLLSLLIYFFS